jgi:hypothetical protein
MFYNKCVFGLETTVVNTFTQAKKAGVLEIWAVHKMNPIISPAYRFEKAFRTWKCGDRVQWSILRLCS